MNYKLTNEQRAQLHRILDLVIDEGTSGVNIDLRVEAGAGYALLERFVKPEGEEKWSGEFLRAGFNPECAYYNLNDLEMNLITAAKLRDEVFTPVLGEVILKDMVVA